MNRPVYERGDALHEMTSPNAVALAPIAPQERIQTLDVLRGFAMFGVLWSNLNTGYGVTAPESALDEALRWTHQTLIAGRFYTLLGFLFGVGFAIQLLRAKARRRDPLGFYLRRLAVLLAIGVAHGLLIWRGDILTFYALIGFFLPFYNRLSSRRLLIAAGATFFGLSMLQSTANLVLHRGPPVPSIHEDWIYAHGSVGQVFAQRAHDYVQWYSWWIISGFAGFLTLFVLGLWVGRSDIVQELPARLHTLRKALVVSVVCCAIGLVLQHNLNAWWPRPTAIPTSWTERVELVPRFLAGLTAGSLATWAMSASYACALTLLYHRDGWSQPLAPLAAVGRMTLTTYLTQSVVCTLLFYSYGAGWYGHVSFSGMFAIAVVLFALQMLASTWWVSRYRFGPVEWLWRSLSYGAKQPMRLANSLRPR